MKMALLAGLALATCGVAQAQTPAPGELFIGFTGSCWRAELGDGVSDTHCFTMTASGKLVMDVHKVRSAGAVVYEGVTLYRAETASGAIRYDYVNSDGDLLPGYARRVDERLVFSDQPDGAPGAVWYLEAEAYQVGTAVETAATRRFVKVGPAGEDGL